MTFRNDHDAAVARADALERELAATRERAAEAEARLAVVEQDRARLETEMAQVRRQPTRIRIRRRPWRALTHQQFLVLVAALVLAALAAIVFVVRA